MSQMLPAGPWRWECVVPDAPPRSPTETQAQGEALVAADGTWLVWAESGYGSPDVHPAVKDLLADAWRLKDRDSRVGTGPWARVAATGTAAGGVRRGRTGRGRQPGRGRQERATAAVCCRRTPRHELASDIAERVDGLLASALARNQVTVFGWAKIAPT